MGMPRVLLSALCVLFLACSGGQARNASPTDNGSAAPDSGTKPEEPGEGTKPGTESDRTPPVTTASMRTDVVYDHEIAVELVADEDAITYFTRDGTDPDQSSSRYEKAIRIWDNTTLSFFSVDQAGNREAVQRIRYRIDQKRNLLIMTGVQ